MFKKMSIATCVIQRRKDHKKEIFICIMLDLVTFKVLSVFTTVSKSALLKNENNSQTSIILKTAIKGCPLENSSFEYNSLGRPAIATVEGFLQRGHRSWRCSGAQLTTPSVPTAPGLPQRAIFVLMSFANPIAYCLSLPPSLHSFLPFLEISAPNVGVPFTSGVPNLLHILTRDPTHRVLLPIYLDSSPISYPPAYYVSLCKSFLGKGGGHKHKSSIYNT